MSTVAPSPRTWTLRFKHHRTTVLVHADPLQKWSLVRSDLLRALHQTHPNGRLDGVSIPGNAQDLLLAKPVDANDLSLGWVSLDAESSFAEDVSGKGKGKVGASGKGKDAVRDCPQGVGLKEGSVLAFKFRAENGTAQEENGEAALVSGLESEVWDVEMPSFEDTYDSAGDEGVDMNT